MSGFYDVGALSQVAINLFHGYGGTRMQPIASDRVWWLTVDQLLRQQHYETAIPFPAINAPLTT